MRIEFSPMTLSKAHSTPAFSGSRRDKGDRIKSDPTKGIKGEVRFEHNKEDFIADHAPRTKLSTDRQPISLPTDAMRVRRAYGRITRAKAGKPVLFLTPQGEVPRYAEDTQVTVTAYVTGTDGKVQRDAEQKPITEQRTVIKKQGAPIFKRATGAEAIQGANGRFNAITKELADAARALDTVIIKGKDTQPPAAPLPAFSPEADSFAVPAAVTGPLTSTGASADTAAFVPTPTATTAKPAAAKPTPAAKPVPPAAKPTAAAPTIINSGNTLDYGDLGDIMGQLTKPIAPTRPAGTTAPATPATDPNTDAKAEIKRRLAAGNAAKTTPVVTPTAEEASAAAAPEGGGVDINEIKDLFGKVQPKSATRPTPQPSSAPRTGPKVDPPEDGDSSGGAATTGGPTKKPPAGPPAAATVQPSEPPAAKLTLEAAPSTVGSATE